MEKNKFEKDSRKENAHGKSGEKIDGKKHRKRERAGRAKNRDREVKKLKPKK
jgi:hypothetical protein